MFFIGIFGIEEKAKAIRQIDVTICPFCSRKGSYTLLKVYSYFHFSLFHFLDGMSDIFCKQAVAIEFILLQISNLPKTLNVELILQLPLLMLSSLENSKMNMVLMMKGLIFVQIVKEEFQRLFCTVLIAAASLNKLSRRVILK